MPDVFYYLVISIAGRATVARIAQGTTVARRTVGIQVVIQDVLLIVFLNGNIPLLEDVRNDLVEEGPVVHVFLNNLGPQVSDVLALLPLSRVFDHVDHLVAIVGLDWRRGVFTSLELKSRLLVSQIGRASCRERV